MTLAPCTWHILGDTKCSHMGSPIQKIRRCIFIHLSLYCLCCLRGSFYSYRCFNHRFLLLHMSHILSDTAGNPMRQRQNWCRSRTRYKIILPWVVPIRRNLQHRLCSLSLYPLLLKFYNIRGMVISSTSLHQNCHRRIPPRTNTVQVHHAQSKH